MIVAKHLRPRSKQYLVFRVWRSTMSAVSLTLGALAGAIVGAACWPDSGSDLCSTAEVQGVEPYQGVYRVSELGTFQALDDAPVLVEGDLVTLTWTEAEVEHQIVWQIESYEWVEP